MKQSHCFYFHLQWSTSCYIFLSLPAVTCFPLQCYFLVDDKQQHALFLELKHFNNIFLAYCLWPRFYPPLAALRYVINVYFWKFRFCWWRAFARPGNSDAKRASTHSNSTGTAPEQGEACCLRWLCLNLASQWRWSGFVRNRTSLFETDAIYFNFSLIGCEFAAAVAIRLWVSLITELTQASSKRRRVIRNANAVFVCWRRQ